MPRSSTWVWALALAGCQGGATLPLSAPDGRERAALLLVVEGDTVRFSPVDLSAGEPVPALQAHEDAQVAWLLFHADYRQLFFDLLSRPGDEAEQQPIPRFDRGFTLQLSDGRSTPIEPDDPPRWVREVSLPGPTADECGERGGCRSTPDQMTLASCVVPCPDRYEIERPTGPLLPALGECQAGERSRPFMPPRILCFPPERTACTGAQAQWRLSESCAPVGGPCPLGDFADGLDSSALHVRPGAPAGGDGSPAAPFSSIQAALAVAQDNDVIGLAKGDYHEALLLDRPFRLVGACSEGTRLLGSGPAAVVTIRDDAHVLISHLSVAAPGQAIVLERGELTLDSVSLTGPGPYSLLSVARGTRLLARDLLIDAQSSGNGLYAEGRVELQNVALRRTAPFALWLNGSGAELVASELVVDGNKAVPSSESLFLSHGARGRLDRAYFDQSAHASIHVRTATLAIDRLVLTEGGVGESYGLIADRGASLQLEHAIVRGQAFTGVTVTGSTSVARLRSLLVWATQRNLDDPRSGNGLEVTWGASVSISRTEIVNSAYTGVYVEGDPAADDARNRVYADIDNLRVEGVEKASDREAGGYGVYAGTGAQLRIRHVSISRAARQGLASYKNSTVDASDVRISRSSVGVRCDEVSNMKLERVALDENESGICTTAECSLSALELLGSMSLAPEGTLASCGSLSGGGAGISIGTLSTVSLVNFRFELNAGSAFQFLRMPTLVNGRAERNGIGARIPRALRDVLFDRVTFVDNVILFEDL